MASGADHPNTVLIRRFYDGLATGDLAGFMELIADDAVFHVGGDSIVAGEHRGKGAVITLGGKVLQETNGTFRTDLMSVLANDSHAVALHRWRAERRGRRIEMDNFNVFRLRDGQIVERWEFLADPSAHDLFWSA